MISAVKNHWFIGILAVIAGLIIVLPTLLSIEKSGSDFQGIYPMFSNDEAYYLSLGREAYDGRYNIGNAFIKEYKEKPSLQQSLAEIIFANEAKILGVSIPKAYAINDFFLPFLGFILLYILFFNVIKSKIISGLFTFALFFIFLSYFNRPTNPQFGFLFFVLGILLVWKIISEEYDFKKLALFNILLGIIFGALIYIYPFYWTGVVVLYAIATSILALRQNNFRYYTKNWLVFGAVSVSIALPYAFNLLKSIKDPSFMEASLRQGMIFNHWPAALFNVALMVCCLALIYLVQKNIKGSRSLIFAYSLAISGIVLNWQNVITGKAIQFSSHYYFPVILFAFLIFSVCAKALMVLAGEERKNNFRKAAAAVLMAALFAVAVYWQKDDIKAAYMNIVASPDVSGLQNLMPIARWLNDNTPKDSAVYALGKNYNWLIPIYTHDNVYWTGAAEMYLMSDEELENRWVIQNLFNNIDGDVIKKNNSNIWLSKFVAGYQNQEVRRKILQFITGKEYPGTVSVDPKYIGRVLEKYQQFKNAGFEKALKTYAADYVLLDLNDERYREFENKFKEYSFLKLAAKIDGVVIFKVE